MALYVEHCVAHYVSHHVAHYVARVLINSFTITKEVASGELEGKAEELLSDAL